MCWVLNYMITKDTLRKNWENWQLNNQSSYSLSSWKTLQSVECVRNFLKLYDFLFFYIFFMTTLYCPLSRTLKMNVIKQIFKEAERKQNTSFFCFTSPTRFPPCYLPLFQYLTSWAGRGMVLPCGSLIPLSTMWKRLSNLLWQVIW